MFDDTGGKSNPHELIFLAGHSPSWMFDPCGLPVDNGKPPINWCRIYLSTHFYDKPYSISQLSMGQGGLAAGAHMGVKLKKALLWVNHKGIMAIVLAGPMATLP